MNPTQHWDAVYTAKGERDVSWFEPSPTVSLHLLSAAGLRPDTCVIDVGGGDSHLVDELVHAGHTCVTVLDISEAALARARARVGALAATVEWIVADVTREWRVAKHVDIWHDRAVFHFLASAADRARYVARLRDTLTPNGAAVMATFAPDGPERCSGLPVVRYSPESLAAELGRDFQVVESIAHVHVTPQGVRQAFQYSRFRRVPR